MNELPYEIPKIITWSYSAYKDFANCPKKYFHTRVMQEFKSKQTPALIYGKEVHKKLEDAVRDGKEITGEGTRHLTKLAALVEAMRGEKLVEYEMAVTPALEPCGFEDPGRWWRGIADLVVIQGSRAFIADYKTGASTRYADLDQLRILAAALCSHRAEIERVEGALLFTELDTPVPMPALARYEALAEWERWRRNLHPLKVAFETNVWNTRRSGLCRFCPVTTCLHNPNH